MGNIREYSSTEALQGVRPSELGVDAATQAARRIGVLSSADAHMREEGNKSMVEGFTDLAEAGVKVADEHYGRQETLKEAADWMQTFNGLTDKWNAMRSTADPNDASVADRFNEEVLKPTIEQHGQGYISTAGQRAALEGQQRLIQHFGVQTRADMVTLQGEAAIQNVSTMANEAAYGLTKDPSGFEAVNDKVASSITAYRSQNKSMTAEQSTRLDQLQDKVFSNNAKATLHGIADSGPNGPAQALKELQGGRFQKYLDEGDIQQMTQYSEAQQRINDEKIKTQEVETQRKERFSQDADMNTLTSNVLNTQTGQVTITPDYWNGIKNFAVKHPDASPEMLRSMITFGQTAVANEKAGKYVQTDPAVLQDLSSRYELSEDDPKFPTLHELIQSKNDGKLSNQDFAEEKQTLLDVRNDKVFKGAMKRVNDLAASYNYTIAPSSQMGAIVDPVQFSRLGEFKDDVRQLFREKYRDGTYRELFDPNNPNYIGKLAQQPKYQTTGKEALQNQIVRMRSMSQQPAAPEAAPIKPAKSLEDFYRDGK